MLELHKAIEHMEVQQVRDLLGAGADPNAQDSELGGFRPLHLAVDIECEEACRRNDAGELDAAPRATISSLLMEAGADPDLTDFRGNTARSIAEERCHEQALELFRNA
jgi:hypothetical protein